MFENMLPVSGSDNSDLPLPLIVAEKWDFPLAYHEVEGEIWYAINDWIKGLIQGNNEKVIDAWTNLQRSNKLETSFPKRPLPYVASDGKTYQREFTTDKGLYLIAQNLRSTKDRIVLKEIKEYLAKAGVLVDKVRRKPEELVQALAEGNPDAMVDAAIQVYLRQGKNMTWIRARLIGKISRNMFTAALQAAIIDLTKQHFALATDEIYLGLWGRTSAILKKQLNLPSGGILRDHQTSLALHYQSIAEEIAAKRLGDRQRLNWIEARQIVRMVAEIIGAQAAQASGLMGMDLATGKPLLD